MLVLAMRILLALLAVTLYPRNLRSQGRATALLASFTVSLSRFARNPPHAIHDALPRALTAYVNARIIRIPAKRQIALLQFPVKIAQQNI